jgi:hypothetical protein
MLHKQRPCSHCVFRTLVLWLRLRRDGRDVVGMPAFPGCVALLVCSSVVPACASSCWQLFVVVKQHFHSSLAHCALVHRVFFVGAGRWGWPACECCQCLLTCGLPGTRCCFVAFRSCTVRTWLRSHFLELACEAPTPWQLVQRCGECCQQRCGDCCQQQCCCAVPSSACGVCWACLRCCKTSISTPAEEHAASPNPWMQSCTLKQGCACTHSCADTCAHMPCAAYAACGALDVLVQR